MGRQLYDSDPRFREFVDRCNEILVRELSESIRDILWCRTTNLLEDTRYAQPDQLYRNTGDGRFAVEALSDAPPAVSRASAWADLDGDGDVDLVGLQVEGPVRVFLNGAASGKHGHWLAVRLRAPRGSTPEQVRVDLSHTRSGYVRPSGQRRRRT